MIPSLPPVACDRPLRVLVDLRPVRVPISGVARYCIELVTSLRSCKEAPQISGLLYGNRASNEGLRRTSRLDDIPSASSAGAKTLMIAQEFLPLVGRYLIQGSYDVVHETYFANVSERTRCPKVATIHDVIPIERPEYANWRNRFFSAKNLRRQARQARQIICVSEYSKQRVVQLTGVDPDKINVIPCGVTPPPSGIDADFISNSGLSGRRYFLFVGNIEPRKNLALAARAVAALGHSHDDMLLVVAGHKNYIAEPILDNCREALGSRFVYLGSVSEEQKAALLGSACALIFPSLYEGFGIPVVEAYQAKCPVLLANNTALTELAVDSRQLFDAESVRDLAARLGEVADGAAWVEPSVAAATSGLDRFSWSSIARRTLDVYRRAL